MLSTFSQEVIIRTSGEDHGEESHRNLQAKRTGKDTGVAASPRRKFQGRCNISCYADPCSNMQDDVSERKRGAGHLTNPTEHSEVSAEEITSQSGKRKARTSRKKESTNTTDSSSVLVVKSWFRSDKSKAEHAGETANKKGRCSDTNVTEYSVILVEDPWAKLKKRKPGDGDGEAPEKKIRCSDSNSIAGSSTTESCVDVEDVTEDDDDVSQHFGSASTDEEKIYEMSSSGNTSRTEFEDKYHQHSPIGAGGFGSVYSGIRISDFLPVAIKHIPIKNVMFEQVLHNGKEYIIILEVALMLKAAGQPGSVGQSAVVSLLDWYILDQELILVMENPVQSQDLFRYRKAQRGSLDEHEAKTILRQVVDAAIDMHAKGVFHRDIKLQNVLLQLESGGPRVRLIDFGCGSFSKEMPYNSFTGTRIYAPPEWIDCHTYSARPTTVWQLGVMFYLLLSGHKYFNTMDFIHNRIRINSTLSTEVKTLLQMCLARDPMERATLEELQRSPELR